VPCAGAVGVGVRVDWSHARLVLEWRALAEAQERSNRAEGRLTLAADVRLRATAMIAIQLGAVHHD